MKKILAWLLLASTAFGQQSVNVTNTVVASNVSGASAGNFGGISSNYGPMQTQLDLAITDFGHFPPPDYSIPFICSNGGTTNTTTSWYSALYSTSGFPAGFFALGTGATYTAVQFNGTTAAVTYGTITASTSNISSGGPGITLTLNTALPYACTNGGNTSNTDVLWVHQPYTNIPVNTITPQAYGFSAGTNFVADTDPGSTNTYQSIDVPSGTSISLFMDAGNSAWPPDPAQSNFTFINMNGTYHFKYRTKCTGTSASVAATLVRVGGSTLASAPFTIPACNATAGAGWNLVNATFTPTETGTHAGGTMQLTLTPTSSGGNVRFQDIVPLEGSTVAGNTTAMRDSVYVEYQHLGLSWLRLMTPASWGSLPHCQIQAIGMQCAAGIKGYNSTAILNSLGYDDYLRFTLAQNANAWITLGNGMTPAEETIFTNWLATSGWNAAFKAKGLKIAHEIGNEQWNSGATGGTEVGNGTGYGAMFGPIALAFRAASGYDPAVDLIIADNWFAGSQAYFIGGGGWADNVLKGAGCTTGPPSTQGQCPDAMGIAPYTLLYLSNFTNIQNDELAEIANLFIPCSYTGGCSIQSAVATQNSLFNQRGIQTFWYEHSYEPSTCASGLGATQTQMNQASASVSMALNTYQNNQLGVRDGGSYGARNFFAEMDQPYTATCGVYQTSWKGWAYLAAGPGQQSGSASPYTNIDEPYNIVSSVGNLAIGNKSKLMSCPQTGTPTFSYPGGQNNGTSNTIAANASVALMNEFCYSDGAGNFAMLAFNMDTSSHTLAFSGASAPTGTVTKSVVFAGNGLYDHNASSVPNNSPAAVVTYPTPTTISNPTIDTLPANTMTAYTWSLSGSTTGTTFSGGKIQGTKFQ